MSAIQWAEFVSDLQHAKQVTHIKLSDNNLGDIGTLLVSPHMTQLQEVEIKNIFMSARLWAEFVSSLLGVQHTVHVNLEGTNIDKGHSEHHTQLPTFHSVTL